MCLTFFVFGCHPPQPRLLLAFNRDEFFKRPAQPLHLWDDGSGVLAGRDLGSGGTWLGIHTGSGRLALLTNLRSRDPIAPTFHNPTACASRGELVTRFMTGAASPEEYVKSIPGDRYNGFNLVVGDLRADPRVGSVVYTNNAGDENSAASGVAAAAEGGGTEDAVSGGRVNGDAAAAVLPSAAQAAAAPGCPQPGGGSCSGSRVKQVQLLEPGRVYGLGNGRLMEWPKVATGVEALQRLLPGVTSDTGVPYDRIFGELMGDSRRLVPLKTKAAAAATDGGAGPADGNSAAEQTAADESTAAMEGRNTAEPRSAQPQVEGKPMEMDGGERCREPQSLEEEEGTTAALARSDGGGGGKKSDVAAFQEQLEHITSGRFVAEVATPFGPYGTRSQTVIVVWHDGSAEARERHRCDDGTWSDVAIPFQLNVI
ncbi:hypothetical protein PLESTB_001170900 [Pleodorina starrii]|uniref:Uncharacterized protein n=1 Tax=Pleodorina starrii TaxID=330485 RepID=A0A9W6BRF7_9CHLO|nr:hypothetical protein PLESTB_001170900 [Pleodorina starrii]GLC64823.1 hypothetical protein PLESTF_000211200 [Pleodorina starrii]